MIGMLRFILHCSNFPSEGFDTVNLGCISGQEFLRSGKLSSSKNISRVKRHRLKNCRPSAIFPQEVVLVRLKSCTKMVTRVKCSRLPSSFQSGLKFRWTTGETIEQQTDASHVVLSPINCFIFLQIAQA